MYQDVSVGMDGGIIVGRCDRVVLSTSLLGNIGSDHQTRISQYHKGISEYRRAQGRWTVPHRRIVYRVVSYQYRALYLTSYTVSVTYQEGYEDPTAPDEDVVIKDMREHECKEDFDKWTKKGFKLECTKATKEMSAKDKATLEVKSAKALQCYNLEAFLQPVPNPTTKDELVKAVWKHIQPKN